MGMRNVSYSSRITALSGLSGPIRKYGSIRVPYDGLIGVPLLAVYQRGTPQSRALMRPLYDPLGTLPYLRTGPLTKEGE